MTFDKEELTTIADLILDWGFEYSLKADREKVCALAERLGLEEWAERNRIKTPKWPGRVTSSTTECAHAKCPDQARCRNGCINQKPITWSDDLTPQ